MNTTTLLPSSPCRESGLGFARMDSALCTEAGDCPMLGTKHEQVFILDPHPPPPGQFPEALPSWDKPPPSTQPLGSLNLGASLPLSFSYIPRPVHQRMAERHPQAFSLHLSMPSATPVIQAAIPRPLHCSSSLHVCFASCPVQSILHAAARMTFRRNGIPASNSLEATSYAEN